MACLQNILTIHMELGKVTIIKYLLLRKIVYMSSLLPTPENIIEELKHLIYNIYGKVKTK